MVAYILVALVVLLKVIGYTLAAGAALVLLLVSLPVKARVSGSASAAGLLEGVMDDDATVFVRLAGSGSAGLGDEDVDAIPLDLDFDLEASVLGGAAGFSMGAGGTTQISMLGLRFHPRTKKRSSATAETNGEEQAVETKKASTLNKRSEGSGTRKGKGGTRKKRRVSIGQIKRYLAPQVRSRTLDSVRSLFGAFHLRGSMDVECGFPEPGTTAMVLAAYWALEGPARFGGITFRANFQGESFEVKASGESRLVPLEIAWIAIRYLLSREIRPLWRKAKTGRTGGADTNRSVGAVST